ncbi:MAG: FHA domain-containing protein [Chitinophagia bacterium]|nr:FHA domain-containing protein [Chitinophagia bacterium]
MTTYAVTPFTKVYTNPSRCVPQVGDKIGEYTVEAQIGKGSFGLVYRVIDAVHKVSVLKLIGLFEIPYENERKMMLLRFEREFQISRIESKYIVKSFECGMVEGNPFFTMEYCSGGSLENWRGKAINAAAYDRMAFEVLSGLRVIHQRGFFHRDIKPQNILLTDDGSVKVADFGIAGHKTSRLTSVSYLGKVDQIFGTWAYIAPEQANNNVAFKALDAVSDIFSFGVTMFEIFTDEYPFPPYQITSQQELITYVEQAARGNADNLEKAGRHIPDKWKKIIRKCIDVDYKHKRYTSVDQIIADLGFANDPSTAYASASTEKGTILKITYGDELGRIINLDGLAAKKGRNLLTMGRKDPFVDNDVAIDEVSSAYISRRHATLERDRVTGRWLIRDGQFTDGSWKYSLNRTYVNSVDVADGSAFIGN